MKLGQDCCMEIGAVTVYASILASLILQCDARNTRDFKVYQHRSLTQTTYFQDGLPAKLSLMKRSSIDPNVDPSMGVDSPFSYGHGSPISLPPFCVYPPSTPSQPSTPVTFTQPPPPPEGTTPNIPSPPVYIPGPPELPGPPDYVPSPPICIPGPPTLNPSPPEGFEPSPPEYVPSPSIYLPPVVYPPPVVPPPLPYSAGGLTLWCVAKPSVPDPIIQEAMNYACGSGADCQSIQPEGPCYQPDTVISHASFAFNSYWQQTKAAGGTCDFGGVAALIVEDPSFDGCQFIYY